MEREAPHPLVAKEIGYIANWTEWEKIWEEETRTEFLHSLLHFGFEVRASTEEEAIARICKYLEIADGCFDYHTFSADSVQLASYQHRFGGEVNAQNLRYVLGQKAFQMLCQNLFKNTSKENYLPSWLNSVTIQPRVFCKILWFFRLNDDGRMYNLWDAKGHNAEIATNFAREFACFAWKYNDNYYDRLHGNEAAIFREARPAMIEILFGLHETNFLLEQERYKSFDEACDKKLEELSLSFKLYGHGFLNAKPKTIEEACFAGSEGARALILLRIMKGESARLERLRDLEIQRLEAEREISKLS